MPSPSNGAYAAARGLVAKHTYRFPFSLAFTAIGSNFGLGDYEEALCGRGRGRMN